MPLTGSLLPSLDTPRITRTNAAKRASDCDAIFVVVAESAAPRAFAELPEAERWRELHARDKPRAGTVRSTTLANSRHTLAVLGYLQADASPFERLSLAGRMLKEASARAADTIALSALSSSARDRASGAL